MGATADSTPAESDPVTEVADVADVAEVVDTSEATVAPDDSSPEWTQIVPGGECECADASEFSFWVREADSTKVVFFLQGGGACFDEATCSFTDGAYRVNADVSDELDDHEGFMDFDNPDNPFAGYTVVFVPYCTGDVFLGNATHEYAPDLTVEHKGYINGTTALQYLADTYRDADHVVVIGESAGAVAAPLYGGLMADALPDAQVTVFADGAGGYPDVPGLNGLLGGLWGTQNAVPDWPENEGMTAELWSFPGMWVQAGTHAPDVVMSRFDYAFDETQVFYAGLAGYDASGLVDLMDANEARVEGEGVTEHSYTAPGDTHTIVRKDEFYEMEVDGVPLVDWLGEMLAGDDVDDVHCTECEPPDAEAEAETDTASAIPATSTV